MLLVKHNTNYKPSGKRSGQDCNPTPLAERANIAHHRETNLVPASLQGIVRKLGPTDLVIAQPLGTSREETYAIAMALNYRRR